MYFYFDGYWDRWWSFGNIFTVICLGRFWRAFILISCKLIKNEVRLTIL